MARDKAIVVSTHILEEVEAVCSRAVIIAKGRIVADSTPEDLLSKAPNHNSVTIRATETSAVRSALAGVGGISKIETLGANRLRIRPEASVEIIGAVGAALREKDVVVDELHVERGRLDDVFRQITATE
jgi:ABC-2 type transport system ATP-binding protein